MTVADGAIAEKSVRWPVKRSAGGWLGLGATAALLIAAAAVLWISLLNLSGTAQLAGLVLGAIGVGLATAVGVAGLGFLRLAYELGPDRLVVRGGSHTEAILLDEIEGIYAGQRIGPLSRVRGLSWPGFYVGIVRGRGLGTMRVYCTDRSVDALSIVVTADRVLVLTPADPSAFRRELIRRIEASSGGLATVRPVAQRRAWLPNPAVAGSFVAALALLVVAVAALQFGYPGLPDLIPLQPDPAARPPTLAPRDQVYALPLLGVAVLGLNLVGALALRGRAAASVLLGGSSALVEAVVLLSTLRLLAH